MSPSSNDTGFTQAQRAALTGVLDAIIPPSDDGRLPGAGELGLAAAVEEKLGAMAPFVARGLDALDARARERSAAGFAALAAADRADLLNAHAATDPGFLSGLVFHTYALYYQTPRVALALGLEARPPHPQGYDVAPSDLDPLLAPVRAGEKRYREVS